MLEIAASLQGLICIFLLGTWNSKICYLHAAIGQRLPRRSSAAFFYNVLRLYLTMYICRCRHTYSPLAILNFGSYPCQRCCLEMNCICSLMLRSHLRYFGYLKSLNGPLLALVITSWLAFGRNVLRSRKSSCIISGCSMFSYPSNIPAILFHYEACNTEYRTFVQPSLLP